MVFGLLVALFTILIVFCVWECFQGERAMVVPRLFKQRSVGITVVMVILGIVITATELTIPIEVVGAALATIASGLISALDVGTGVSRWVGYQILGGVGWGIAFQIPIITAQGSADAKDMSSVTAVVLFFMNAGGTYLVSAAQSAFVNKLIATLRVTAPGVNPTAVVATDATQLRVVFPRKQVPGNLLAYMAGVKVALMLSIAATGCAFLVGVFGQWKRTDTKVVKDIGGVV